MKTAIVLIVIGVSILLIVNRSPKYRIVISDKVHCYIGCEELSIEDYQAQLLIASDGVIGKETIKATLERNEK